MKSFRTSLMKRLRDTDEGISLAEVLVAMMIFMIVSLGVIETLVSTATFAIDSRARETATSLAAQTIDTARATTDVFGLFNDPNHKYTVDGRVYTVDMIAQWVSDPNQIAPCGGGGGALQYKRVNVSVKWTGMSNPKAPVQADTLIAPTTRVSDPSDATILVSVADGLGNPISGATVTTTPALSPVAKPTDVDGCSYLLKVPVGTYTINVSKAGYINTQQTAVSSKTVSVTAGSSFSWGPTMDVAKPLALKYASNYPGPDVPKLPVGMFTSLLHATDAAIDASTLGSPPSVYPFADGYNVVAGRYLAKNTGTQGCLSPNQTLWPTTTVSGITYAAPALPIGIPAAGASVNVQMGIVKVKGTAAAQSVSAVLQTTGPSGTADPGCAAIAATYNFGAVLNKTTSVTLALPFGSYKLYYSTNGTGTQVTSANMTVTVPSTNPSTNIVTLDPRVAQ